MNSASSGCANSTIALENLGMNRRLPPVVDSAHRVWLHLCDVTSNDLDRRIHAFERAFRSAGLPNLIADYSVREDVFNRAIPFLALVFVGEMTTGLDIGARFWQNALFFAGGAAVVLGLFGVLNLVRGRHFLALPRRVGVPEIAAFVLLPAIPPAVFNAQIRFAFGTIASNVVLLALVYVVVGFGLIAIVRWAGWRLFSQLRAALPLLVRAVPLLLFFSLVAFFTTEIWQVFTVPRAARYWTAIALFVLLGSGFLLFQIPDAVRNVEREVEVGLVPLRRRERANIAAVLFLSQGLQVLFVSAAVWLFFVVLGALLVTDDVRASWVGDVGDTALTVPFPGGGVAVSWPLLRVATGVASFAGLYYAVAMLVDAAFRDRFVDGITEQLRDTFVARAAYLRLLTESGRLPAGMPGPVSPSAGAA
jgi:hypothetical protein